MKKTKPGGGVPITQETAKSILDGMQQGQIQSTDVDMSKACQTCGNMGATKSGDCLPCVSKRGAKPAEAKPEVAKPEPKPEKKGKKVRPQRIETIMVKHEFSEKELVALGAQMADESRIAESIESEAKTCARQYKDKLVNSKTKIAGLVDKIKEGFEMVPVDAVAMIQISKKDKTARKCFYRKDTGAFIREENALNVEFELFNVLPEKSDYKKALPKKLLNSQV